MNKRFAEFRRPRFAIALGTASIIGGLLLVLLVPWRTTPPHASAHYAPTPNAPGDPLHTALQFSYAIDDNGDNANDCLNALGSMYPGTEPTPAYPGPLPTCIVPVGDTFRVKVYLTVLGDIPGYTGLNFNVYTTGPALTAMDDPNCESWPDHSSISPVTHYSNNVTWSCNEASGAPLSYYTGLVSTFGFLCTPGPSTGNTIFLAYGYGTNVIDANGHTHGPDAAQVPSVPIEVRPGLTVDCVSASTNDSNGNGLANAFEAGFGSGGISINNPDTSNTASATGSAAAGSIITSGSLAVHLPGGTHSADGINPIQVTYGPGPYPVVLIQNADVGASGGGRKSVEMPIGSGSRLCINDQATATLSSVTGSSCPAPGVRYVIPASGSASHPATTPDGVNTVYTITRVSSTLVRVDGLVHTAAGVLDGDADADGCPDAKEQQTAPGSQISGGLRDYLNPWDYDNPTYDGQNRVDDILKVVGQYYKDDNDGNPGVAPYALNYNPDTDRTLVGPNQWNLGPPDGQQRIDDILNQVKQYYHDCA